MSSPPGAKRPRRKNRGGKIARLKRLAQRAAARKTDVVAAADDSHGLQQAEPDLPDATLALVTADDLYGLRQATTRIITTRDLMIARMFANPVRSVAMGTQCSMCHDDCHDHDVPTRLVVHWPSCGDCLHAECAQSLFTRGIFRCPMCQQSVIPADFDHVRFYNVGGEQLPLLHRDLAECPAFVSEGVPVITYPPIVFEILSQYLRLGLLTGDFQLRHLREALLHAERLQIPGLIEIIQDFVAVGSELGRSVDCGGSIAQAARVRLEQWLPPPPVPRFRAACEPRVTATLREFYDDRGIKGGLAPNSQSGTEQLHTPPVCTHAVYSRQVDARIPKRAEAVDDGPQFERFHQRARLGSVAEALMFGFSVSELSRARKRGLSSRDDTVVGDFGGTATTESASHHHVQVVVDRVTRKVLSESQFRANVANGVAMASTCWFTTRNSTQIFQDRHTGVLTAVGQRAVCLRREIDAVAQRMDAEKLRDAKRVCRPLRHVRIGLASIGGMCGDDARKYAKVMLGLIQEQVGVAAVSNASFSQNGSQVSLLLDLDMRFLQCGSLGAGMTLVVSEPSGADSSDGDEVSQPCEQTVHVHVDPDAGFSWHASVSQGTEGGDCVLIPPADYAAVRAGSQPMSLDGPSISAQGYLHCVNLRQGHCVTPVSALAQGLSQQPKRVACIQSTNVRFGMLMDEYAQCGNSCVLLSIEELKSLSAAGLIELSTTSLKKFVGEPTPNNRVAGGRWINEPDLLEEAASRISNQVAVCKKIRSANNARERLRTLAAREPIDESAHVRLTNTTPVRPSVKTSLTTPPEKRRKRVAGGKSTSLGGSSSTQGGAEDARSDLSGSRHIPSNASDSGVLASAATTGNSSHSNVSGISRPEFESVVNSWTSGVAALPSVANLVSGLKSSPHMAMHTDRPQIKFWLQALRGLGIIPDQWDSSSIKTVVPLLCRSLLAVLHCTCKTRKSGNKLLDYGSLQTMSVGSFETNFATYDSTIRWLMTLDPGEGGSGVRYGDVFQETTLRHGPYHSPTGLGTPMCDACKPGGCWGKYDRIRCGQKICGLSVLRDKSLHAFAQWLSTQKLPASAAVVAKKLCTGTTKVLGTGKLLTCFFLAVFEDIGLSACGGSFIPALDNKSRGSVKVFNDLGLYSAKQMKAYLVDVHKRTGISALVIENVACKCHLVNEGSRYYESHRVL